MLVFGRGPVAYLISYHWVLGFRHSNSSWLRIIIPSSISLIVDSLGPVSAESGVQLVANNYFVSSCLPPLCFPLSPPGKHMLGMLHAQISRRLPYVLWFSFIITVLAEQP